MLKISYKNKNDIENELDDFKILFAYHSNKIENEEIRNLDILYAI